MSLVSISDMKAFAGIDYNTHDAVLQLILTGTEDFMAQHLDAKFERKERIEYAEGGFKQFWLSAKPVISVKEIYDVFGEDILSSDLYTVESQSAAVILDGYFEPGMRRYRITYTGGWTVADTPAAVKLAVMMLAARAWESRTGRASMSAGGFSFSYQELMQSDIMELVAPHSFARGIV